MHVRTISPCVTSRKADDDDDAFAAHARDARVEVLILTHRALFSPYRAHVHRLFSRSLARAQELLAPNRGQFTARRWLNEETVRFRNPARKKIKKMRRRKCSVYVCARSRASLHVTRSRRDTRAATRTTDVASAAHYY